MRYFLFLVLFLLASCAKKQLLAQTEAPASSHSNLYVSPSAAATADKMNVFYIGVDNALSASIAGVASTDIVVSIDQGTITKDFGSHYIVRVTKPGQVKVTVSSSNPDKKYSQTFSFRVKRIPDPVPVLGSKDKHEFTPDEFHHFLGLMLWLDDFDFEARCENLGFTVTRISKDGTRQSIPNEGIRFTEATLVLIKQAQGGDVFIFSDIKAHCPGDEESRRLASVAFFITTP